MFKRTYTCMFATLGVLLSLVFCQSAMAGSTTTFDYTPDGPYYAPVTITMTDTSGSDGLIEWSCDGGAHWSPGGRTASCTFNTPIHTAITQRIDGVPGGYVGVEVQARADQPFHTILAGSSTVNLDGADSDLLVFQSPKNQFNINCDVGSSGMNCPAEVVRRDGPDASNPPLYNYYVRIDNAPVGTNAVTLRTDASNAGSLAEHDQYRFPITVASNPNYPFGLVDFDPMVCQADPEHAGKVLVGPTADYYLAAPHRWQMKVAVLRRERSGGGLRHGNSHEHRKFHLVKKVTRRGDYAGPSSTSRAQVWGYYLYEQFGSIRQKPEAFKKYKLYLKAKVVIPGHFRSKTKTTRIRPSNCG